jgi:hypothetical protein
MAQYAFKETSSATSEITKLFDFVWPTAIALWNLRLSVRGFLDEVPHATQDHLKTRFALGSGFHNADLRVLTKTVSWDEQKERFAEITLTNAFAIYESWAKHLIAHRAVTGFVDKDLWTEGRPGRGNGLNSFIAAVNASPSTMMTRAFKPTFARNRKYFPAQLNNILLCYRYFKEARNCQMHNGGIVDQKTVNAYLAYSPVSSAASMRTKEAIEHFPMVIDTPARLSIRGVVGFVDILLRMMVTIDVELSGSMMAEKAALDRFKKIIGPKPTLGSDRAGITRKINSRCEKAGYPNPIDEQPVKDFLLANRIVIR